MNKNILEVKFTKINDAYSVGEIVYQDEKILERGVFDDKNLKISSFVKPAFQGDTLLIRGKHRQEEIKKQFNALNKKQKFILGQLEVVNEEIENKIIFNDIQYLMNAEFDEVMKTLINKKNEIKATEENIRKRAEEEKIRALEELEAKKEIEKQQAIEKAQNKPVQEENRNAQENVSEVKKSCENVKYFNTTIRFEKAPLTFLKELKILSDRYQITYELKENIEL